MTGLREVAKVAAHNGVTLAVEPLNRFETYFINIAEDAVKLTKDVDHPNFKVHLDTFHMIREEDDMVQAVRDTGSLVGYVHACENQRGIPGSGMVPWLGFLEALRDVNYDYCITIESFDPEMVEVAKMTAIWRKLADSPEQLATEGLSFLKDIYREVHGVK